MQLPLSDSFSMRMISLLGSLTGGATLMLAMFNLPVFARVALLIVAVAGLVIVRASRKRANTLSLRVAYVVDNESERYSDYDVAEFVSALSRARARTDDPFYWASANQPDHDGWGAEPNWRHR